MGVVEEETVQERRMVSVERQMQLRFGHHTQRDDHRKEGQRGAAEEEPIVPKDPFHAAKLLLFSELSKSFARKM